MTSERLWIWGRHPVLEALRARTVIEVHLARGHDDAEILAAASREGVPVHRVSGSSLESVAQGSPAQGVAAQTRGPHIWTVGDLLASHTEQDAPGFYLVLDQVQDPHNLGALLRTADAAGVRGVILPERRGAPLSGTVAKTSAGALSHIPIAFASNLARSLDQLRQAEVWIMGLDEVSDQSIYGIDLRVPLALVLGNEGSGLRRLTRERCDIIAGLPMHGTVASLNASVAGGIAMYEVLRQRM